MERQTKGEMTRQRVLYETRKLIMAKGFNNTSISEILAVTGVKKGTLYFHFSGKEELGLAILRDAADEFFRILDRALQGGTELEKIDRFLDAMIVQQRQANFVGGCLFGNTALEMADSNPGFAEVIQEVFERWIAILEQLLSDAKRHGSLTTTVTPHLMAKHIVAAIEGGIMMARVSKDEKDLTDCVGVIRQLLGLGI